MKTYNSPMLQIVGINKKDIIATSLDVNNTAGNNLWGAAPGVRDVYDPDDKWANAGY